MAVILLRPTDETVPADRLMPLKVLFEGFEPPYRGADARAFTACYRTLYASLSKVERRQAEQMVDRLIAGLENPEDRQWIFGVF
jgi:hypothetical protein